MDIVNEILTKTGQDADQLKSIFVKKHLDLEYDLKHLLAVDINDFRKQELRNNKEEYLKSLARDNVQLLINQIWELPTERVGEAIVVNLPPEKYIIPREKPAPKAKPMTKWQQYVQDKGIRLKKKEKLVWDDVVKKWIPRYGYKRVEAERQKNWVLEVPDNVDPYTNMFERKATQKSENVAKNELQRLRNLAAAKKVKVPRLGVLSAQHLPSGQFKSAAKLAKVSTASIGKFQPAMPQDKKAKMKNDMAKTRKKPYNSSAREKKASLRILESILKKSPELDVQKGVNESIFTKQKQRSQEKKNEKKKADSARKHLVIREGHQQRKRRIAQMRKWKERGNVPKKNTSKFRKEIGGKGAKKL